MKHQCITNPEGVRVLWGNIDDKFVRKTDATGLSVFYKEGEGIVKNQTVTITKQTYDDFLVWANQDTNFERTFIDSNNEETYMAVANIGWKNGRWVGSIIASDEGMYKVVVSEISGLYELEWTVYSIDPNQSDVDVQIISNSEIDSLWSAAGAV